MLAEWLAALPFMNDARAELVISAFWPMVQAGFLVSVPLAVAAFVFGIAIAVCVALLRVMPVAMMLKAATIHRTASNAMPRRAFFAVAAFATKRLRWSFAAKAAPTKSGRAMFRTLQTLRRCCVGRWRAARAGQRRGRARGLQRFSRRS